MRQITILKVFFLFQPYEQYYIHMVLTKMPLKLQIQTFEGIFLFPKIVTSALIKARDVTVLGSSSSEPAGRGKGPCLANSPSANTIAFCSGLFSLNSCFTVAEHEINIRKQHNGYYMEMECLCSSHYQYISLIKK